MCIRDSKPSIWSKIQFFIALQNLSMQFWIDFYTIVFDQIPACFKISFRFYSLDFFKEFSKQVSKFQIIVDHYVAFPFTTEKFNDTFWFTFFINPMAYR